MSSVADIQNQLDGPALAPPPGVTPNFVNPPSFFTFSVVVVTLCLLFSTLAICMRMYTKLYIIRRVVLEDYVFLLAGATFVGYSVPVILAVRSGAGIHQWNLQLKNLSIFQYYFHIASIMYGIVISIIKLAILLQYLRIFVPIRNNSLMFWASHILIWTNLTTYLLCSFLEILACSPMDKAWNILITNGHCINMLAIDIASAAFNSLSDCLILILPHRVIWKLQVSFKRKLGISTIFLTGLFACVSSLLRLYYAIRLSQTGDITYYATITGLCAYPEMAFGIIAGCLPVTPKFFRTLGQTRIISNTRARLHFLFDSSNSKSQWSFVKHKSGNHSGGLFKDLPDEIAGSDQYGGLANEQELVSTSRKASSGRNLAKEEVTDFA